MYRILFTKNADKALRRMPLHLARRIRERLDQVAQDPYAQHTNVTRLRERAGYRLRLGDWRVLYEIETEEQVILVLSVAPRGEVYR